MLSKVGKEFIPEFTNAAFKNYFLNGVIQWNGMPAQIVLIHAAHAGDADNTTQLRLHVMLDKQGKEESVNISAPQILNWEALAWPELGYLQAGKNLIYWAARNHAQVQQKAMSSQTLVTVSPEPNSKMVSQLIDPKERYAWNGEAPTNPLKYTHAARWLKWGPTYKIAEAIDLLFSGKQGAAVINRGTALTLNPYKDGNKYPVLVLHRGMTVGRFDLKQQLSFVEDVETGELW